MIGRIFGVMECFGILGIISYYFNESSYWVLYISIFLIIIPIAIAFISVKKEKMKSK